MDNNTQKHPLSGKKIALYVLYGIIALCLLFTVLSFNDLPGIMEQLKTIEIGYVFVAALFILIYLAIYPFSLCILTKVRGCDVKMSTTYVIAMTEHFFNCITPLATGGQPFQAHSFSRVKVKISESTGLLLTNLLIYMAVTTGFSLVGLFYWDALISYVDPLWIPIIIVGYSLNFLVLVVIFFLGTSKTLRGWLMKAIYFFCRFKLFKRFESKAEGIRVYFEQVQAAFADLVSKKWSFIFAFLSKVLSFVFLYGSTYFALLSMNIPVQPEHFALILFGTSFAITAVGFVPTPGASGGVEGAAGQVFKSIIVFIFPAMIATAPVVANGVMLVWRLVSYYFVIVVSLLFYIALEIYLRRKEKKLKLQSKQMAQD